METLKRRGRPPGKRPKVPHRTRPDHAAWSPLHVTLRTDARMPNLRCETLNRTLERAFRTTRRPDFRIVEFSVQTNHLHLIVEATDNDACARGMKSFTVRANRLLNAATGRRRGRVWADRYHRRALKTPRQVRNALVYCLHNIKKHRGRKAASEGPHIDRYSSARWFEGWAERCERSPDDGPRPTPRARTDLLRFMWRRLGLIHPRETPRLPD